MKRIFLLITLLASISFAENNTIKIEVQGLMGPTFDGLLQEYSNILSLAGLRIESVDTTIKNGFGKTLGGTIYYRSPDLYGANVKYIDYDLTPNCVWGDIFSEARKYINMIKIQNGRVVSFQPTIHNGYGKPCSARLGYVQ